jgi:ketosteroid isomerase-like protein
MHQHASSKPITDLHRLDDDKASRDVGARRPLMDRFEVRFPVLASLAVRGLLRSPAPVRRRVLTEAFARAENAFNRGDLEAVFALFAPDVSYTPPPALHAGPFIRGRANVLPFWKDILARYDRNRIVNLTVEETNRNRFVRTAQLSHESPSGTLDYAIRQTTELRKGRVVSQVNAQLPESGPR